MTQLPTPTATASEPQSRLPFSAEPLLAQQVSELTTQHGYCIVENVLDTPLIDGIRSALGPWLQQQRWGRNDFEGHRTERVYGLLAKAPILAHIVEHPLVLEVVEQLLGTEQFLLSAALAINVHPGETPQRWHSDDSGGFMGWPRGILGVSTIWAFDDFTADNGATELIPGSHQWQHAQAPEQLASIKATMPAGSCLFFMGNLTHRGGANNSAGSRLAITPQYCRGFMRQLENMVLAVPPEVASQYSERLQGLLGYSVVDPGFMGHVNGLHPKRLINDTYAGRKDRGVPS